MGGPRSVELQADLPLIDATHHVAVARLTAAVDDHDVAVVVNVGFLHRVPGNPPQERRGSVRRQDARQVDFSVQKVVGREGSRHRCASPRSAVRFRHGRSAQATAQQVDYRNA